LVREPTHTKPLTNPSMALLSAAYS